MGRIGVGLLTGSLTLGEGGQTNVAHFSEMALGDCSSAAIGHIVAACGLALFL